VLSFEWDEQKNRRNRAKHGIWFEEARTVFDDPDHSEEEDRFLLLGMSSAARTLVVVHCYRKDRSSIRIISARKATKKEARIYEEGI
jgi:hypothetical protein